MMQEDSPKRQIGNKKQQQINLKVNNTGSKVKRSKVVPLLN
jgi:hypothetical protein